jgi:TonB family protein
VSFEQLSSFLLSLCLHLAVLVLALFWPASKAAMEEPHQGRLVSGIVTIGKEGKTLSGSRQAIPEAAKGRPDRLQPIEKPLAEPPVKSVPKVAAADRPEPRPELRPIEKPLEKILPDAVPIPKKPEKAPAPQTANAGKVETPVKANQGKEQPKKSGDIITSSLNSLSKEMEAGKGKSSGRGASGGKGQDLSSALRDLSKELGSSGAAESGLGPGGDGGDGHGVLASYQDSIISRVSSNWSWPGRTDRKKYTTVVNIQIDSDGSIKNARIVSSSGNAYFDATVLQAVAATNNLEPPPRADCSDIDIRFTPEALGTR